MSDFEKPNDIKASLEEIKKAVDTAANNCRRVIFIEADKLNLGNDANRALFIGRVINLVWFSFYRGMIAVSNDNFKQEFKHEQNDRTK